MITYKYEDMLQAGKLLNQITASGSDNFRMLAEIADILDSGKICKEMKDPGTANAEIKTEGDEG